MASQFRPYRRSFSPRPVKAPRPVRLAPAGAVVDAVLRFHDVVRDQGGGIALLRLSETRLRDPEVRTWLGEHAANAAGVSILWNEREGEILRVLAA